jgi:hypothetical protein
VVAVIIKFLEDSENTLFFFTVSLIGTRGNYRSILLVSLWIVYVLFYVLVSALLIVASIQILRRKRG